MGYAAGNQTTMCVTDLVWKLAHISGFSLFAASAEEASQRMGDEPSRGSVIAAQRISERR